MQTIIGLLLITILFATEAVSQNYIGYNKEYIKEDMKSKKKEMKGPINKQDAWNNYMAYFSKDGKRAVYYHFKETEAKLPDGSVGPTEICYKYISKTKCRNNLECPEMEKVVNSLNSHFSNEGNNFWTDYSKPVPHEWIIVKQDDHFEVHVTEAKSSEKSRAQE